MSARDKLNLIRDSPFSTVDYSIVFGFEEGFDHEAWVIWFQKYWIVTVFIGVLYILLVFFGRRWMEHRPRYDLRRALTAWSSTLAIFSWCGTIRLWTDFIFFIRRYEWDFKAGMCDPVFWRGVVGFWYCLFIISKLPELCDTVFIILRKQKLLFLHWSHHFIALIYCWYSYAGYIATMRYFALMNYTVHAFMYTYYAVTASKVVPLPRWVSMYITAMQLIQMVIGVFVNITAYKIKGRGEFCWVGYDNLAFSLFMYVSFLILFTHLFYVKYIRSAQPQEGEQVKKIN